MLDADSTIKKQGIKIKHQELQLKGRDAEINVLNDMIAGLQDEIRMQKLLLESEVINAEAEMIKEKKASGTDEIDRAKK